MMPYPFDCPVCTGRFWEEESVVYDERYDDSVCYQCAEEPKEE
jgi:hypothetical protein